MIYKTISTLLQKADPELAHSLAIKFLKNSYLPFNLLSNVPSSKLEINILGKNFTNPVGLAAGFDKNAFLSKPAANPTGFVKFLPNIFISNFEEGTLDSRLNGK